MKTKKSSLKITKCVSRSSNFQDWIKVNEVLLTLKETKAIPFSSILPCRYVSQLCSSSVSEKVSLKSEYSLLTELSSSHMSAVSTALTGLLMK